uniref:Uncharacterized protein n=1 Tax=Aegilops tauschii subsp. strangulata TaxID=200361 RepID=A0A453HFG4_AEGTS
MCMPLWKQNLLWKRYVQGLEVATICVEDMDEWLGIFNIKLRHMREDIQSVIFLISSSSSQFNFRITIS